MMNIHWKKKKYIEGETIKTMGQATSKTSEHHCCGCPEHRNRTRKQKKRRGGDAALNELMRAAGDLLKEHVKDVKEQRTRGKKRGRRGSARERGGRRELESGYQGYQPAEGLC